ncbi:MAG: DUF3341 domain-containing protein [Candidatus Tectomicrobia bacterium]|uniref:DUF3341 domain-containing protein n=1 Tax=Tectimicrobiota bacterium TaxID=2528274 RepID=A0A933GMT8_UNCTE|nr:DUF3341 domain-containing protein [Candidatus Tectomicrobia bacterium]
MRENRKELVGTFKHLDALLESIRKLRQMGHEDFIVLSPMPHHDITQALGRKISPIRFFTLVGALVGCASGFALAAFSALKWGLIAGGKPVISIPPFVVIAFEATVLLSALATVFGLLVTARLPRLAGPGFDPRFSQDHFGIVVRCSEKQLSSFRNMFNSAGAVEISEESLEESTG